MFYKLVTILMLMSQSEACLDLLVRSFNEIFSPIIETSDGRIQESHNVDELTNYYKREKSGHFIQKDQGWHPSNPYLQNLNPKNSKIRDEHMVKSVFDQLHVTSTARMKSSTADDPTVGCHSTEANNDPSVTEVPTNSSSSEPESSSESATSIYDDNTAGDYFDGDESDRENEIDDQYEDYEDEEPRGNYVPGERPLIDIFIKIMEMFQLTSKL